jgi:acyl-CoA synthetase (AMP-forming)/AMP-acid ligase II
VRWTQAERVAVARGFMADLVLVSEGGAEIDGNRTVTASQSWFDEAMKAPAERRISVADRRQPLILSLSSGTTGKPKGPVISHGNILNRLQIYTVSLGFNERDRFLLSTPLYFGGGRYMALCMLMLGGTVVLARQPVSPAELLRIVDDEKITSLFLVPTLLRRLLSICEDNDGPALPAVRRLISSGSILHARERDLIQRKLSPEFFNFYASTEGGGVSVLAPDDPETVSGSIGRPVFGTEVELVGPDHKPVPKGDVGEIRYRGGTVADGFYRDPDATAEAFRDGWYYPGDLGRYDEDGYLYLVGRTKDMIIRGGVNIYPFEIEQLLLSHPDIAEAAVVAWPSPELGEEVAAFVVPKAPLEQVDRHLLDGFCRANLAPYKVPKDFFTLAEMPKNAMGKILKANLSGRLPPLPARPEKSRSDS